MLLGLAVVAHGQAVGDSQHAASSVTMDPTLGLLSQLLAGGGLPAALGVGAWWLRGQIQGGIPVTVELGERSLTAIRRSIRRGIEHADTESDPDSDDPKVGT